MENVNILIVDDEPIMCRGLAAVVERDERYNLVGCCHNGEQALQIIEKTPIDILITDIKMPIIDGLELVKILHSRHPEIKKIILSGFSEFEYAKHAIKYGVQEYLLKPIDNNEFEQSLEKLRDEALSTKRKKTLELLNKTRLEENIKLLKEKTLSEIAQNKDLPESEIPAMLAGSSVEIKNESIAVAIICLQGAKSGDESYKTARMVVDDILMNYRCGEAWGDKLRRICILFDFNKVDYSDIILIGHELVAGINSMLNTDVLGSISGVFDSVCKIAGAYNAAHMKIKDNIFNTGCKFIEINETAVAYDILGDTAQLEENLLNYIKHGNKESSLQAAEQIFDKWSSLLPHQLEALIKVFVSRILRIILEENLEYRPDALMAFKEDVIFDFDSMDSFRQWFFATITDLAEKFSESQLNKYNSTINKVVRLIETNYAMDITIGAIADIVYLNSNYLSQLFKQQTGKNFIDYLTEHRVNKAKDLLKGTNLKTYAIATMVGYNDARYFAQVFKKNVGMTPGEFRKL